MMLAQQIFLFQALILAVKATIFQNAVFYDQIRETEQATAVYNADGYVGRNLYRVNKTFDHHDSLLFCHLPTFLEYSDDLRSPSRCMISYSASAAAILAIHHFNNGDGSIVPEITDINKRCNLRLTTEMLDSGSSPFQAVRSLTEVLTRPSSSFAKPQPCAILGSEISTVTSKLATLSGVFDLFQVSSSALSSELDDLKQYPLFARSHTDVAGFGEMSISFLKSKNINTFCTLVPNDSYGMGFQQSVLQTAASNGMRHFSSSYLTTLTSKTEIDADIKGALQVLKDSRCNYIIGAFYTKFLSIIMGIAYDMGLAGPGKFWLISGTASVAPFTLSGNFIVEKESSAAKAIAGNGITFCRGGIPGVGGNYDKFTQAWRNIGESPEALDYLNSKQPVLVNGDASCTKPADFFSQGLPHHISTFTYDAIVSLGVSACDAMNSTENNIVFSSKEHRDSFASKSFRGASGDFILRENFPTRTADSSYFVMVNMKENELNDTHVSYKGSPLVYYWDSGDRQWERRQDSTFIYSDGTTTPPVEMDELPIENEDNILLPILLGAGFFILLLVILVAAYVIHKNNRADAFWQVKLEELEFEDPPEILGRGTFGLVLVARYRGTEVAVKRVIPSKESSVDVDKGSSSSGRRGSGVFELEDDDIEAARSAPTKKAINAEESTEEDSNLSRENAPLVKTPTPGTRSGSGIFQGTKKGSGIFQSAISSRKGKAVTSILRTIRGIDSYDVLKREFIAEMRLLAKLRHPCITTVMGAVLDGVNEPMLVMECMERGSLHDILHNKTMELDGELILPLLSDITQGMRFLHCANPAVIHGDLKSANVLVDRKFRAKVADFGLSQKKRMGASGTPYWMSPELLRGESDNTTMSDVYAFGIILYEVYSRKNPYEGEDYNEVISAVKDPILNKRPPVPAECPSQLSSLMRDCIVSDPEKRPDSSEIDERLKRLDAELTEPIRLEKEQRNTKTNKLLFDVFPKPIAEALRDGRKIEPTCHELVTIFFSDIVGFTNMSSTLSPMKVSDMLDRLYNAFDNLSQKHDVFKVETIGDAYMAVTNLVKDQPDHAKRIADFAVGAVKAANGTLIDTENPSMGYVEIRVGFHSGSVVANVVGTRNPRYCLFGDTVNTASRMESNSEVNRIHCSESSASCLKAQNPAMPLVSRGAIPVKGKGTMKTFWVNEESRNGRKRSEKVTFAHVAAEKEKNKVAVAEKEKDKVDESDSYSC
eukprot:CAMPEP_0194225370 /NCGR_PEP_ID=MMETSP0156-20130528/39458_1 /TAXON_ID=33649 /ORGANISM="Thalassionema nitzschioides, Strain L26-B" /LENGTH=1223 /DNA_ID=CAMNT_0038957291 /DNA_START=131 /DNA_END=3802 /DNA_ORIENTATION=+